MRQALCQRGTRLNRPESTSARKASTRAAFSVAMLNTGRAGVHQVVVLHASLSERLLNGASSLAGPRRCCEEQMPADGAKTEILQALL